MIFSGLEALQKRPGHIDFTLDELGEVDLKNEARVVGIRFVPGLDHMSIFLDFRYATAPKSITLEFVDVELTDVEYYLPRGVDPIGGYAVLMALDYWAHSETGREGFSFYTTTLEVEFYAEEVRAHVRDI